MAAKQSQKLPISAWISIISFVIGLVGASAAGLSTLFTTKDDFNAYRLTQQETLSNMQLSVVENKSTAAEKSNMNTYEIKTLKAKVENIDMRQTRVDQNIIKIMERMRLKPAPEPTYNKIPESTEGQ